jgi:hypothetical protein
LAALISIFLLLHEHLQIDRLMQLMREGALKRKELFDETKAVNLRMQSKDEEFFTKLSVLFEQAKSESQILKTECDELMQEKTKLTQSEATLQAKFQARSNEISRHQVQANMYIYASKPESISPRMWCLNMSLQSKN